MQVDAEAYSKYCNGAKAQDVFPHMNPFEREMIISGNCYSCQERIFNRPAPGNESLWGERLGECMCCGSSIYEKKHNVGPNMYQCASCGEAMTLKDLQEQY